MDISIPPGVFDILPENDEVWKSSYLWNYVESIMKNSAKNFGFHEIRTPLFEKTELFKRGVGESSDIVTKEMYTFIDKGQRSLTLKPEGTAPVMRAFIDNHLNQKAPFHKLFYVAPMFRYERAQAGRFRQHHQFGVEAIGIEGPEQDAEIIALAYAIFKKLDLQNLEVSLNSIGNKEARINYQQALKSYLQTHFDKLSADSQVRFKKNPLRILDSKDAQDRALLKQAPSILDFLSESSKKHFEDVQKYLTLLKIPYKVTHQLVRGLDYYNETVFEVTSSHLGAQNSICGGGRYDGLLKSLSGPDLASTGFALGIERVLQTMLAQKVPLPQKPQCALFLIPLGGKAKEVCFSIQNDLREGGISVQTDFSGRKLNKVMNYANQIGAKYTAVIGDTELEKEEVNLKEMATGTVLKAPLYHLKRIFQVEAATDEFLNLWSEMTIPFENPKEADFFIKKLSQNIEKTSQLSGKLKSAIHKIQNLLE